MTVSNGSRETISGSVETGVPLPSVGVPVVVTERDPRDRLGLGGASDDSDSCERWVGLKVAVDGNGSV